MPTLNTFNRHLDTPRYEGDYHFYLVDFMDIYSGNHYFRLIDAGVNMTHKKRMEHFDADINGSDPARYTITAYEIDMDDDDMESVGLKPRVLYDTYWSSILQGAV